jgi:hypothetical protein
MGELQISTTLGQRHAVFDQSGELPFTVLFGLMRRSKDDLDPRPLTLDTRKSALDVPYAIAHGLLCLVNEDGGVMEAQPSTDIPNALRELADLDSDNMEPFITLSSPVNRPHRLRNEVVTRFEYLIEKDSALGSMLRPGTKYGIRFPSNGSAPRRRDLGIRWCAYGDPKDVLDDSASPLCDSEPLTLIALAKSRVSLLVVPSLPWPPKLVTSLELALHATSEGEDDTANGDRAVYLRVTTIQSGSEPVSVQTRGRPWYIHSKGLWDEPLYEHLPRIIHPYEPAPETCVRIVDQATGHVVRDPWPLGPSGPSGYGAGSNRPPLLDDMVTIEPGRPLVRLVDISKVIIGWPMQGRLSDGQYEIHLLERGMWWCWGSRDELAAVSDNDRLPQRLWNRQVPPARLFSENAVEFRIQDGQVLG